MAVAGLFAVPTRPILGGYLAGGMGICSVLLLVGVTAPR